MSAAVKPLYCPLGFPSHHVGTPALPVPLCLPAVNGGNYMLLPTPATLQMMSNWTAAAVNEIKEKRHDQQGMDNLANKAWRRCGNAYQCEQNRDKVGVGLGGRVSAHAWATCLLVQCSSAVAPRAHASARSPPPCAALRALPLASLRCAGWLTHPALPSP